MLKLQLVVGCGSELDIFHVEGGSMVRMYSIFVLVSHPDPLLHIIVLSDGEWGGNHMLIVGYAKTNLRT